jgi:hypothetical protein
MQACGTDGLSTYRLQAIDYRGIPVLIVSVMILWRTDHSRYLLWRLAALGSFVSVEVVRDTLMLATRFRLVR